MDTTECEPYRLCGRKWCWCMCVHVYFRNWSSGLTAVTSHPRELDRKPAKCSIPPPFWLAFGLVNVAMTVTKSTQFNIGSWNCHWIVVWIEKWVSLPSSFTSSFMEAWLLRDLLLFELFSTKKLIFQFREPVTWLLVSQRLTSNRQLHHELSTHKFDTSFNQLTSTTSLTRIHFESTR